MINKEKLIDTIIELCREHDLSIMVNIKIDVRKESFIDSEREGIVTPLCKNKGIEFNHFTMSVTEGV